MIGLLFTLLPLAAVAQQAWTLERCVDYAVANSPVVNSANASGLIARQDRIESVASLFPSISAGTYGQFNFGRSLGEDNIYTNVNSFTNSLELYGSMVLFDGLASVYRVKMNRAAELRGRHEEQRVRDKVAFGVMESFFLVQGYGDMVELCREQLEESKRNFEQTERMAEIGLRGYPDVAEMQAEYAAARYNLTRQENLLAIGIIQLKEKMNFPLNAEFVIVPYEGDPAAAPNGESVAEIFEYASETNPVLLAAKLNEQASVYNYKAAKGSLFPSISLNGGYNTGFYRMMGSSYESYWNQLRNKRGHYLGFSLSIPIFGGLTRSSNVSRAGLNMYIARNDALIASRALYSEIEQALADVRGQADEYRMAVRKAEAAELSYRLSQRKYNEGLISAVELHTSSNRMLEARAELTSSRLMYHLKRKLLDYYKGIPLYGEYNYENEISQIWTR